MPHLLEEHIPRFAGLLASGGMTAFFSNPLVTPEPKWFPVRWTPDLESARDVLLRLAEFGGLDDLELEVGLFSDAGIGSRVTDGQYTELQRRGVAGLFLGIESNTAYFGIERELLDSPRHLLGTLAHELAHAWRARAGVVVGDRRLEEELTDLTTVLLGWGILTANAAFQYESRGDLQGVYARTQWSFRQSGYLDVDVLSGLLAMYVRARGDAVESVRAQLDVTQLAAFDEAWQWLQTVDLEELLALPPFDQCPEPRMDRAAPRAFARGPASREVHRVAQQLVSIVGEEGGIASEPIPFEVRPFDCPHVPLATWARANAGGGWRCSLYLAEDPEWRARLIIESRQSRDSVVRSAVGLVSDRVVSRQRELAVALAPLFDPYRGHAKRLFPGVPAGVEVLTPSVLGIGMLEELFRMLPTIVGPQEFNDQARWVMSAAPSTVSRVRRELAGEGPFSGYGGRAELFGQWWSFVTAPAQAQSC